MAYVLCLYWASIGLHILSASIILTVLLVYCGYYLCVSQKQIKLFIKIMTIIGNIGCLICAISNGFTIYIDKDSNNFNDIFYNAQAYSHAVNNAMTYMIYIYRLHLSFKDTVYRMSNAAYTVLGTLITIDLLDFVGDSICYIYLSSSMLIYLDLIGLCAETLISILCS